MQPNHSPKSMNLKWLSTARPAVVVGQLQLYTAYKFTCQKYSCTCQELSVTGQLRIGRFVLKIQRPRQTQESSRSQPGLAGFSYKYETTSNWMSCRCRVWLGVGNFLLQIMFHFRCFHLAPRHPTKIVSHWHLSVLSRCQHLSCIPSPTSAHQDVTLEGAPEVVSTGCSSQTHESILHKHKLKPFHIRMWSCNGSCDVCIHRLMRVNVDVSWACSALEA